MGEQQLEIVQRVNSLMTKFQPVLMGQPVLIIYITTLAMQQAIKDRNPGVAESAQEIVDLLGGFEAVNEQ